MRFHPAPNVAKAISDEVGAGSSQKMRPNQKARALIRFHRIEKRSSAALTIANYCAPAQHCA